MKCQNAFYKFHAICILAFAFCRLNLCLLFPSWCLMTVECKMFSILSSNIFLLVLINAEGSMLAVPCFVVQQYQQGRRWGSWLSFVIAWLDTGVDVGIYKPQHPSWMIARVSYVYLFNIARAISRGSNLHPRARYANTLPR